jgi:hypothetical protein
MVDYCGTMLINPTSLLPIWSISITIDIDLVEEHWSKDKKKNGCQVWIQRDGQRMEKDGSKIPKGQRNN